MIDTHCHLTFPDFADRVDAVLTEAAAAGVTGAISISTTTWDCLDALAIARRFDNVWCTAGVHPLYSDPHDPRAVGRNAGQHAEGHVWQNLKRVAADPRCVAWGELGLDNHYQTPAPEVQRRVLDEQIAFIESCHRAWVEKAKATGDRADKRLEAGLPVVIHCRKAVDDLLPVLRASSLERSRFVFHCFTERPEDVKKVLDFGAWVSFTGVVTYPNAPEVRESAKLVPADRIMVETDAPFLPPVPHRGKRPCVPAWVAHTGRALAEIRGVPFERFHEQVNQNTTMFFGIPA